MPDLLHFTLHSRDWGDILIARSVPQINKEWGLLEVLRDTPWGKLLAILPGEILSLAVHGHVMPMMRLIGPPPEILLKKVPDPYRVCSNLGGCIMGRIQECHPCTTMPDCYCPPGLSDEASLRAAEVALCWREGRYVVVTEGEEFHLA